MEIGDTEPESELEGSDKAYGWEGYDVGDDEEEVVDNGKVSGKVSGKELA